MYPVLRLASVTLSESRKPRLGIHDTHKRTLRCWPTDLDVFLEMNNGRVLTLFDLGRTGLSLRTGLARVLRQNRWGLAVAGASVRYRKRITAFQSFDLHTKLAGWDDRFIYIEQAMWRGDTCCNHILLRTAVTEHGRLLPMPRLLAAMGIPDVSPPLTDWAQAWIDADTIRPWPPQV